MARQKAGRLLCRHCKRPAFLFNGIGREVALEILGAGRTAAAFASAFHDVGHEAVDVEFEVGISAGGVQVAVGLAFGQVAGGPFVGDAVVVAVLWLGAALVGGPSACVGLRVYEAVAASVAAFVFVGAVLHVAHDAGVDGVALQAGAGIGQYAVVGVGCGVCAYGFYRKFGVAADVVNPAVGQVAVVGVGLDALPVVGVDGFDQAEHLALLGMVLDGGTGVVEVVAADVEGAPDALDVLLRTVVGIGLEDAVHQAFFGGGRRTGLVVVVHEVVAASFAGIASVGGAPVVEDVVAQVHPFVVRTAREAAAAEAGRTALVVGHEVVVEAGAFASPDASVAVAALAVDGVGEAFAEDAPLHGEVLVAVEGRAFVRAPAHAAMVDDDVLLVASPHGVVFGLVLVAHAAADEADDDVVGLHHERVVLQADAVAGGGLSGDGDVAVLYLKCLFQLDDARDVEYDDAGPCLPEAGTERAFAVVVQVGHVVDGSAPSAGGGEACVAFGAGKGGGRYVDAFVGCVRGFFFVGRFGGGDRGNGVFGGGGGRVAGRRQQKQKECGVCDLLFHDVRRYIL